MLDPAVAVELDHAEVAQVRWIRLLAEHDARAVLLLAKRFDAGPDRPLKDVVGQEDDATVTGDELLGQAEGLGDAAGLVLVGVEEALDAELVPVAEEAQKLARMGPTGDQHDLVHARAHQRFDCVVDHRAVVDRKQVLVGDPGQRMEAAASAPGEYYALHRHRILGLRA